MCIAAGVVAFVILVIITVAIVKNKKPLCYRHLEGKRSGISYMYFHKAFHYVMDESFIVLTMF